MTGHSPSQPKVEEAPRLVNGEFYAKKDKIFRAPIETKTETGTRISVGFPVCHVSDYVDPDNLVECLNASRDVDDLRAKVDELTARELMILAHLYKDAPLKVANLCDDVLDQSGGLLGRVRDRARASVVNSQDRA